MSKNANLDLNDFVFVRSKRKGRKPKTIQRYDLSETLQENLDIDKDSAIRRIETAKEEIAESDLFCSVLASLREGSEYLKGADVKEIVCLGIGHVGERIVPRYQLGLLLCLKEKYNASVYVQDPVLWKVEKEILTDLGLQPLDKNIQGKYKAKPNATTIFFLPHCPKQLTNNLLWRNWGVNLCNCIVIANSFTNITETLTKRQLMQSASYISNIFPHTLELAVVNSFKYFDVFNDTAIHIFPSSRLSLIPIDFWKNRTEPKYEDDAEFIRK